MFRDKKKVSIFLDESFVDILKQLALSNKISVSEFVKRAVLAYKSMDHGKKGK